ncbi:S8 family serine peptidase [Bowmanella pacifica]|uniref:Collagenolytic serine protease n=1 Tax=Bowmanella pacifica TaxID=502051 RepID=A0A917YVX9_9ALTE|nr:S8 family serine peptidase [Bowmanella pacifica]GGO67788.1 collagenolytic serine protease [Bowmanella pacifica]
MKYKLSAFTLAMLPMLANASVDIQQVSGYASDSVIVVYKEKASLADRRAVRGLVAATISDSNLDEVDDRFKHLLAGRMAKFELRGLSVKAALEKLQKHPAVSYAQPNYRVRALGAPNDARFGDLWGLHNEGQTGGTVDADIDAVEAWDIATGSRDVIVGVIDTGVDYTHPDLVANMWVNPGEIPGDGVDNDGNGYIDDVYGINSILDNGDPMDDHGHGSHVAGTVGAEGNNGVGVVGVSQQVSLVGCKFLASDGFGSTADAIQCVDYFVALKNAGHNVRVLNNSWGGGPEEQALRDAITASEQADILFVAAAGNDTTNNDVNPHYPSNYEHDSILSVTSTNHNDGISWFSNWGLTTVDLAAPGSDILSTLPGGSYGNGSGTSMASPHVAGAAALVMSVNPGLSALEVKQLLMDSGDDNADMQGKIVSGKRLNLLNAVEAADPTPGFRFSAAPLSTSVVAGETASYEFIVSSVADWDGSIALSLEAPLADASLSASSVSPGDSFMLTVPTTADTQWGDYEFTVTGTSGELVKSQRVALTVIPQGLTDFTYNNNDSQAIPDNDADGIISVINIPDDITVFGTDAYVNISHTWSGDLLVKLTAPSGTEAVLHNRTGSGEDDIDRSFQLDAFNGEIATGDWLLSVSDNASLDTGTLNSWSLTITGIGEVLPAPPQAGFSAQSEGLQTSFTDTSTDVNGDIVSWSWDFGDGNSSSEQNPLHMYAASGTYSVTLTVTDSEGNTDSHSMDITVSDTQISLEVQRAYLTGLGYLRVDLAYTGSPAEQVDIYRNGVKIATVDNTGVYRDRERRVVGTQFVYKVCDASDTCSDDVNVSF